MIHKVNRPEFRLVVNSTKSTQNDPGSSQGGGVAYESLPDKGESRDQGNTDDEGSAEDERKARRGLLKFGELVLELQGVKREPQPNSGLTTQYQREGSVTKGLLLNKKAE